MFTYHKKDITSHHKVLHYEKIIRFLDAGYRYGGSICTD